MDPLDYITDNIFHQFFNEKTLESASGKPETAKSSLIHAKTADFNCFGEFFVDRRKRFWISSLRSMGLDVKDIDINLFEYRDNENEISQQIISESNNWLFPIRRIKFTLIRMEIFLSRAITIKYLFTAILNENTIKFGQLVKDPQKRIYVKPMKDSNPNGNKFELSFVRANMLRDILIKVLEFSKWSRVSEDQSNSEDVLKIEIVSVASKESCNEEKMQQNYVRLVCGIVTEGSTQKPSGLTLDEYVKIRSKHVHAVALHKLRLRGQHLTIAENLGIAAVPIDLFEVKHSSPVHSILNGAGSTRGAVFIMYNMARCQELLRVFNERFEIESNIKLPPIDDIDFSLLKEQEEWKLIFKYMFCFPNILKRSVEQLEKGKFSSHLLIHFLAEFVSDFSLYYHRYRIITNNCESLTSLMFARIYLIKAIREILVTALDLFDIKPIHIM